MDGGQGRHCDTTSMGARQASKVGAAMANEGLINLLGWCGRQRETLQMQREMLQSGKFRISKDEGSGQVDASAENIGRITANIRGQHWGVDQQPCLRKTALGPGILALARTPSQSSGVSHVMNELFLSRSAW